MIKIIRVTALPSVENRQPNALYFLKTVDGLEIIATNDLGETSSTPTPDEIQAAISQALVDFSENFTPLWSSIDGTPTEYTPSAHTHLADQISDLESVIGGTKRTYSAQQTPKSGTLTDASTVTWDCDAIGQVAALSTSAARVISNPTNVVKGASYVLILSAKGFTPAWGSNFKWPLTDIPKKLQNAVYIFSFIGGDSGILYPTGPGYLTIATVF